MQLSVMRSFKFIWSWTFGGLPDFLTLPGAKAKWSKTIKFDTAESIKEKALLGEIIDIVVPPEFVHLKELTVPKAASKELSKIVDTKVTQSFPQRAKNLVWNYTEIGKDSSSIQLVIHLIKRKKLEGIIEQANEHKVQTRSVSSRHANKRLLLYDDRRRTDRIRRLWNYLLFFVTISAVIFVLRNENIQINLKEDNIVKLRDETVRLEQAAVKLRERVDIKIEQKEQVKGDLAHFRNEHRRLPIFIELSELFSDGTWVSELSIERKSVFLSILSTSDVTQIVQDIRTLDWVSDVELAGPVSFDRRSRRNRFEVTLLIAGGIGSSNE